VTTLVSEISLRSCLDDRQNELVMLLGFAGPVLGRVVAGSRRCASHGSFKALREPARLTGARHAAYPKLVHTQRKHAHVHALCYLSRCVCFPLVWETGSVNCFTGPLAQTAGRPISGGLPAQMSYGLLLDALLRNTVESRLPSLQMRALTLYP
jgi:hypothetical protein